MAYQRRQGNRINIKRPQQTETTYSRALCIQKCPSNRSVTVSDSEERVAARSRQLPLPLFLLWASLGGLAQVVCRVLAIATKNPEALPERRRQAYQGLLDAASCLRAHFPSSPPARVTLSKLPWQRILLKTCCATQADVVYEK